MAEDETKEEKCSEDVAEIRIALAMSGAIALVLYESGVAHELHAFASGKDKYAGILEKAGLRPVVDILTGASAGGINSVFLGNCLVNGADFDKFANVWIQLAGVDTLRYGAGDDPGGILNIAPLKKTMGDIFRENIRQRSSAKFAPTEEEIKVRLCRTDLKGFCVSTLDAAGHKIDIASRSDVLSFDNDDFLNPEEVDTLVDAAAATSAFPIAFPPVFDKRWYVDGGLWDNQPIDLAIEAIRDKPAFARTHRCVLFVDPDPSVLSDDAPAEQKESDRPSPLEAIAFIPGIGVKGNVLPALDSILDSNKRRNLYDQAIGVFGPQVKFIAEAISRSNEGQNAFECFSLLDQARTYSVLFDNDPQLIQTWTRLLEIDPASMAPVVAAAKKCLDGISSADLHRRAVRRNIAELNQVWKSGANPELSNRKRELYEALSTLNQNLEVKSRKAAEGESMYLSYRLHRGERVSRFWEQSRQILLDLSAAFKVSDPAARKKAIDSVNLELWNTASQFTGNSLWLKLDELAPITAEDKARYVLASISDLEEKHHIDLIRVSPNDANNLGLVTGTEIPKGTTAAGYKLAGEGLGHLVGFFEERWRRNDYVWGRLDAAEILLRTLRTYAQREAKASGCPCKFEESDYHAALAQIQTQMLQDEAKRFKDCPGRERDIAKGLNPGLCGATAATANTATIQEENRKVIGYGRETVLDANEPEFSRNVEYITTTASRLFRGPSGKPPAALDRLARISRILAYLSLGLTWIFPLKPFTTRAQWIRGVLLVAILGVAIGWGYFMGSGQSGTQVALTTIEIALAALALLFAGAGLGFKYGWALFLMLALGLASGMFVERHFGDPIFRDPKLKGLQLGVLVTVSVAAFGLALAAIFVVKLIWFRNDGLPPLSEEETPAKEQPSLPRPSAMVDNVESDGKPTAKELVDTGGKK